MKKTQNIYNAIIMLVALYFLLRVIVSIIFQI